MKSFLNPFKLLIVLCLFSTGLFAQSNQYLHFDKVDDWVQLPNASQLIVNTNTLTITGWFYHDVLGYGQGEMGFRGGNQAFYLILLNNGQIECCFRGNSGTYQYTSANNAVIPQMWQHLAWVYDGSTVKLYVNGNLKVSKAASGVITNGTIPFAIGKSTLGGYNFVFGGRADEVTLWNVALTQADIQNMMTNEPAGTEAGLLLYYKFNQGVPGGNNTSITKLISQVGNGDRDADLMNFALVGDTSNFGGVLDPGYQAISFPQIPNKLTTSAPFNITATATSGLTVDFEVVSGPATISGSQVTLTGTAGDVVIRASQNGGGQFDPATPVVTSFKVLDPAIHVPDIDVRSPLTGDVRVPVLKQIQLAAISTITYPELFQVTGLHFEINGTTIPGQNFYNDHYAAWWTPPAYGTYTMNVVSENNYGYAGTQSVTFQVIPDTASVEVTAAQGIWLNMDVPTVTVDAELPSFLGAFDKVTATLSVSCPSGGCGAWDRVASVDVKGHDGKWHEFIRYITPYGVACSHRSNVTDFISLLQGKVSFRFNCATLDNGYNYALKFNYQAGIPEHCYSLVNKVWKGPYPFGDLANMQPVENFSFMFPENTISAKLKLVSTGHGWGELNTDNAAEFYDATHHIWVNGAETFSQHNWYDCDPNPDGCQPQNGTWYHNRAGWCPGAIAQYFDYDMTPFISTSNVQLGYVLYPNYTDFCHPHNPNCVTGVTCTDCNDGFNPYLEVACHLVVFADDPIVAGIDENKLLANNRIEVFPNPTRGILNLAAENPVVFKNSVIQITNVTGKVVKTFGWSGEQTELDLSSQPKGIYFLMVKSAQGVATRKFILM